MKLPREAYIYPLLLMAGAETTLLAVCLLLLAALLWAAGNYAARLRAEDAE